MVEKPFLAWFSIKFSAFSLILLFDLDLIIQFFDFFLIREFLNFKDFLPLNFQDFYLKILSIEFH